MYKPLELFAQQVSGKGWTYDETKVWDRQLLTPVGGAYGVRGTTGVNALLYWNTKNEGIEGNCSVIAFNAFAGPSKPIWADMLEEDCDEVNLETDWVNAAISLDGGVVAATSIVFSPVPSGLSTVTLASWNGQNGVENWRRRFQAPNASWSEYWGNRGVALSDDGRWIAATIGAWFLESVPTFVFDAFTGEERSRPDAPLPRSDAPTQPYISADGGLLLTTAGTAGNAMLHSWSEGERAYVPLGLLSPPEITGGWSLTLASFARSPSALGTQDIVGVTWVSSDLTRAQAAVYDAKSRLLLSSYLSLPSVRLAVPDATIHCHLRLCAAGLAVGDNSSAPSVVVLSADAKAPVFEFATGGSVQSTTLAPGTDARSMHLAASGCSTPSICTGPGGNAFLWLLTGMIEPAAAAGGKGHADKHSARRV